MIFAAYYGKKAVTTNKSLHSLEDPVG